MASGPSGTGWSDLVVTLNDYFTDAKRGGFADKFKGKHGPKGEGDTQGKRPYKFGQFVDQFSDTNPTVPLLSTENQRAQFLIDAGTRHWDPTSLDLLEHAIKRSLTREKPAGTPASKRIIFNPPTTDNSAVLAKAEIRVTSSTPTSPLTSKQAIDQAVDTDGTTLTIDIVCPPSNLRPAP